VDGWGEQAVSTGKAVGNNLKSGEDFTDRATLAFFDAVRWLMGLSGTAIRVRGKRSMMMKALVNELDVCYAEKKQKKREEVNCPG